MGKTDANGMKRFHNTRVKYQRLMDGTEHYGWVVSEVEDKLVIQADGQCAFEPGEEFEILLSCKSSSSTFNSTLLKGNGDRLFLSLPSLIRMDAPTAEARRKPPAIAGEITSPEPEKDIKVIDIAPKGLGITTGKEYEAGQMIDLRLETKVGVISLRAQIVYCRADSEEEGVYRTGVFFDSLSRLDQARWVQVLAA